MNDVSTTLPFSSLLCRLLTLCSFSFTLSFLLLWLTALNMNTYTHTRALNIHQQWSEFFIAFSICFQSIKCYRIAHNQRDCLLLYKQYTQYLSAHFVLELNTRCLYEKHIKLIFMNVKSFFLPSTSGYDDVDDDDEINIEC